MRGKQPVYERAGKIRRNIPAYAGKTSWSTDHVTLAEEHPRVCGENDVTRQEKFIIFGTSPRMRGKLQLMIARGEAPGNIPAYAGKTLIDVRFLVPEGHFTFGFVFLHGGGSMESP